jgi:hypothetical protein
MMGYWWQLGIIKEFAPTIDMLTKEQEMLPLKSINKSRIERNM